MKTNAKQFIVSGKGLIPEGEFDYVQINGSGKAFKPVTIKLLEINGSLTSMAPIIAEDIRVNGTAKFRELTAERLDVSGSATINGQSVIDNLVIRGNFKTTSNVSGNHIEVFGKLQCHGEIEAEFIEAEGSIVAQLVNAENVRMNVWHRSTISIIQATTVDVRKNPMHKVVDFFSTRNGICLQANEIEADKISLVATQAAAVRGATVHIGEGCIIDLVEYTEHLTVDAGATVKQQVKIL